MDGQLNSPTSEDLKDNGIPHLISNSYSRNLNGGPPGVSIDPQNYNDLGENVQNYLSALHNRQQNQFSNNINENVVNNNFNQFNNENYEDGGFHYNENEYYSNNNQRGYEPIDMYYQQQQQQQHPLNLNKNQSPKLQSPQPKRENTQLSEDWETFQKNQYAEAGGNSNNQGNPMSMYNDYKKPFSLVDLIQKDFPRTPSPVYALGTAPTFQRPMPANSNLVNHNSAIHPNFQHQNHPENELIQQMQGFQLNDSFDDQQHHQIHAPGPRRYPVDPASYKKHQSLLKSSNNNLIDPSLDQGQSVDYFYNQHSPHSSPNNRIVSPSPVSPSPNFNNFSLNSNQLDSHYANGGEYGGNSNYNYFQGGGGGGGYPNNYLNSTSPPQSPRIIHSSNDHTNPPTGNNVNHFHSVNNNYQRSQSPFSLDYYNNHDHHSLLNNNNEINNVNTVYNNYHPPNPSSTPPPSISNQSNSSHSNPLNSSSSRVHLGDTMHRYSSDNLPFVSSSQQQASSSSSNYSNHLIQSNHFSSGRSSPSIPSNYSSSQYSHIYNDNLHSIHNYSNSTPSSPSPSMQSSSHSSGRSSNLSMRPQSPSVMQMSSNVNYLPQRPQSPSQNLSNSQSNINSNRMPSSMIPPRSMTQSPSTNPSLHSRITSSPIPSISQGMLPNMNQNATSLRDSGRDISLNNQAKHPIIDKLEYYEQSSPSPRLNNYSPSINPNYPLDSNQNNPSLRDSSNSLNSGVNKQKLRISTQDIPTTSPVTGLHEYPDLNESRPHSPSIDFHRSSLLDEFRTNKNNRKFELRDIVNHVVEFSTDQHGSRFIQQKLETASVADKEMIFEEILPAALKLMIDVFGNYVIQKFFEYGTEEQIRKLGGILEGQILYLSLQMYGCRVIQKLLQAFHIFPDHQKEKLIKELDGNVIKCVKDQNGNHVIQKCIEKVPSHIIQFIVDAFQGQVYHSAIHPYGCRVIQRMLEYCDQHQIEPILNELLGSTQSLVQDQYGNYVIQHVLEHGRAQDKSVIITKMKGQIIVMSQHKFASNVIEKCVQYGSKAERSMIIEEILGNSRNSNKLVTNLLTMMKDQYANYVIQKIIDVVDNEQRELLIQKIKPHIPALKKYTYGKHIISRLEKGNISSSQK